MWNRPDFAPSMGQGNVGSDALVQQHEVVRSSCLATGGRLLSRGSSQANRCRGREAARPGRGRMAIGSLGAHAWASFKNGLRFEGGWGRRPKGGDPGSAACAPGARIEPPATPRLLPAKNRKLNDASFLRDLPWEQVRRESSHLLWSAFSPRYWASPSRLTRSVHGGCTRAEHGNQAGTNAAKRRSVRALPSSTQHAIRGKTATRAPTCLI